MSSRFGVSPRHSAVRLTAAALTHLLSQRGIHAGVNNAR